MPPHVLMNFRGFPPGCGDSVADFWGWDAQETSRRCEWWYAGRWNTRKGLKPKSTNYTDHGHHGNLFLQGKIPMVEPGIEPGTSCLVVIETYIIIKCSWFFVMCQFRRLEEAWQCWLCFYILFLLLTQVSIPINIVIIRNAIRNRTRDLPHRLNQLHHRVPPLLQTIG